jgi:hypothetical protein
MLCEAGKLKIQNLTLSKIMIQFGNAFLKSVNGIMRIVEKITPKGEEAKPRAVERLSISTPNTKSNQ